MGTVQPSFYYKYMQHLVLYRIAILHGPAGTLLMHLQLMYLQYNVYLSIVVHTHIYVYIYTRTWSKIISGDGLFLHLRCKIGDAHGMLLLLLHGTNKVHVGHHEKQCDETTHPWPYVSEPDSHPPHQVVCKAVK